MTTLYRFGIILLTAGLLLVSAVLLIWFAAPLGAPPTQQPALSKQDALAAPVLATLVPGGPALASAGLNVMPEDSSLPSPLPTLTMNSAGGAGLDEATAYAESRTLAAQRRSAPNDFFRLAIPALEIDAPVVPVAEQEWVSASGRSYKQWAVPDSFAAGWHDTSALPGQAGNTVLNGHNNIHGSVFGKLVDLALGEHIILYKENRQLVYQVVYREFLPERGESLRTRLRNARWILPSDDTRLTLVTCWPNSTNTHRLVVVAEALEPVAGH